MLAAMSGSILRMAALSSGCRTQLQTHVLQTGVLVGAGETHHLALNFGAGGLELYLDGAQVGSLAYTGGLVGNAEPIVIGANQWSSGDLVADKLRDGFDGEISSAALYGSRLTSEQIGVLAGGDPDNNAPVAGDDGLTTDQDVPLSVDVASDLLANDSDANGDALSLDSFTQPANGTLTDNGDGTLSYTPNAGYNGVDSFTYTITDGTLTDTANVSVTVNSDTPPPASDIVSDDFAGGVLDPVWSYAGIDGLANLATTPTDGISGNSFPRKCPCQCCRYTLTTPRLLQSVSDQDFQISAGFLNEPAQAYQEHGLLVIQDDGNWIRCLTLPIPVQV